MASKRAVRRRACGDKVRYKTRADAEAAALGKRVALGWAGLHAYRCGFGPHFHIGHQPAKVRQAIAARRAR